MTPERVVDAVVREMAGPMDLRRANCTWPVAAVFQSLWGVDLLAGWPAEADRLAVRRMRTEGGFEASVRFAVVRAGLVRRAEHPGALGLVRSARRPIPAICIQPCQWAAKTKEGFGIVRNAVEVWGLPCRNS